jgi:DNA-binding transcriptional regulator YhcF (GntR family)
MAVDASAGERAYRELKGAILSGELKLRQRLDIDALAEKLRVSATPVRQALAILTSERFVTLRAPRGYYVTFWTERELGELYGWRFQLARMALESFDPKGPAPLSSGKKSYIQCYEAFMERLEAGAGAELRRASRAADERLSAALRAEPEALDDVTGEIARLISSLRENQRRALATNLRRYFKRRINNVGAIRAHAHARAVPQNGE